MADRETISPGQHRFPAHLVAGRAAEDAAARFLEAQGLVIVLRNYRVRGGEIDLIAREGETLVFVEVRWRRSASHGGALGSIDGRKQRRIAHAAACYLQRHAVSGACRIDALCAEGHAWRWIWVRGIAS